MILILFSRYLRRTFQSAIHHHRPDLIVYLGDVFDEGSQATDQEFLLYVNRLKEIFRTHNQIKHIYVPGDNDVGGEGSDPRTVIKLERFHRFFNDTAVHRHKFIDFLPVSIQL